MNQFALPLELDTGAAGEFLVGPANAIAVEQLRNWSAWPHGTAILIGPTRSGKTNMGTAFHRQSGGLWQDDADRIEDERLFHLWNRARNEGRPFLMASRLPVARWQVELPDLRSRLAASQLIEIAPPDEAMIDALLRQYFIRRGTAATEDAIDYTVKRLQRSYATAEMVAHMMEGESRERQRPVNRAIAQAVLARIDAEQVEE